MDSSNIPPHDSFTSYKQLHENFMKNNTGSSIEDTIYIQTPLPILIFFTVLATNYVAEEFSDRLSKCVNYIFIFIVEFLLLVILQVFLITSSIYDSFYSILFVLAFICNLYIIFNYIKQSILEKWNSIALRKSSLIGKRPYITYFRTSVNLTTTICILAVDFTVFPRSYSKTETYGFSLMDTGVGYFVVCNGLVSHNSESRIHVHNRTYLIFKLIRKNIPLFVMGFTRFITVSNLDYQEHVSEYGVHWNFFITLAFTKVFTSLLLMMVERNSVKYLALATIFIHQTLLSCGLENWVISDLPRSTFVLANREGIVSIPGYVSLYLISIELGTWLRANNSTFERDVERFLKLMFYSVLLYFIVHILNLFFNCSRRLANITYVAWITMLSLYLLSLCQCFELTLRLNKGPAKISQSNNLVPGILSSINFNALSFFLVANLLTGLINLTMETLYVNSFYSILIIIFYQLILFVTFSLLDVSNLKLPV